MTLNKVVEFDTNVLGIHPVAVAVGVATALTSSAFGKEHVFSAAGPYAITLPPANAASANKCVAFSVPYDQNVATGVCTIVPAGTDFLHGSSAGPSVAPYYVCPGQHLVFRSNGAGGWLIVHERKPRNMFHAEMYKATSVALGAGDNHIVMNGISFDTPGWCNTTSGLYLCRAAGWYRINQNLLLLAPATTSLNVWYIAKNGTAVGIAGRIVSSNANYWSQNGMCEIFAALNDYIRPILYTGTVGGTCTAGGTESFMEISYLGNNIR